MDPIRLLISNLFISFLILIFQSCSISTDINHTVLSKRISIKPYKIATTWYQPTLKTKKFQQQGIASWYGKKFHGRKTSNGEIFNMNKITAAHKTLPFNSWVHVLNLTNNKSIEVRINDRGPFVKNRIIDLSYAAAKKIDMIKSGTAMVKITCLGEKKMTKKGMQYIHPIYESSCSIIQIGSYKNIASAIKLKNKFEKNQYPIKIIPFKKENETLYKVQINGFLTFEDAVTYEKFLKNKGFYDAFIISK